MTPVSSSTLSPLLDVQPQSFPEKGFHIHRVSQIAFTVLAAVCVAALVITASVSLFTPLSPLFILGMKIATLGLSLLLFMKLWEKMTPHLCEPLRKAAYFIQSIFCDVLSAPFLGCLLPINYEKFDPKKEDIDKSQRPILLVHGFLGMSNNWAYHIHRLKEAGFKNIFTVNLGFPWKSIEEYTARVKDKVQEIKEKTGWDEIDMVGHSMGGLVAREWLYTFSKEQKMKAHQIVTLGAPLNGTKLAYIASYLLKPAKEMEPESDFVKREQEKAKLDGETLYTHIGSSVDSFILPYTSSYEGKSPKMRFYELEKTGHIGMLFSDRVQDAIQSALKSDF